MLQQQQQHLLPFTPIHLQQSAHNNPWRNRENPLIPRKRYFTCKITTRSGVGSGGDAECHIPPPAGLGRAVPNSRDKGSSGGTQLSAGTQLSRPAWRQRQRPRHLMRGAAGVPIISAISWLHLSQLLLWHSTVQLVPKTENEMQISGTQDMMLLVGNYQLADWNSLYIFKGITSSSTEVWKLTKHLAQKTHTSLGGGGYHFLIHVLFFHISKLERQHSCLTIHLLYFIDFSYEAMFPRQWCHLFP